MKILLHYTLKKEKKKENDTVVSFMSTRLDKDTCYIASFKTENRKKKNMRASRTTRATRGEHHCSGMKDKCKNILFSLLMI